MSQPSNPTNESFKRWLLAGRIKEMAGPEAKEGSHETQPWWKVVCLTGLDLFSSLGYQPGIAALAAGILSPIATLILVSLMLFGALPMYRHVAVESPHGDGSISMLRALLSWWTGKVFILCLIGFAATSFIITITLSAADATAHIVENPFTPDFLRGQQVIITLVLLSILGGVFLKGFKEAIAIAVVLVGAYLLLNLVVVFYGIYQIIQAPHFLVDWRTALFSTYTNPFVMLGISLLLFPKLALGLSGFETGVLVMPLVQGYPTDTPEHPVGRIRNSQKLLTAAATIMSFYLILSSLTTIMLIPAAEFLPGGKANGRALAYMAHQYLGNGFGTVYDLSTIFILWFAGASAMAGLLNIVPRYLPRYGMAPDWASATRPLVLVFTAIAFIVTIIFQASVDAQSSAYATGVLVMITSAAIAVAISMWRHASKPLAYFFGVVAVIFIYATVVNILEQPDGLKIAAFFIVTILLTSFFSRAWRSTELRTEHIVVDETAQRFLDEASHGTFRLVAHQIDGGDIMEYNLKELEARRDNNIPPNEPILFMEVYVSDASEFADVLEVRGVNIGGYHILRIESSAVPNAIASFLFYLRDKTGKRPHVYFTWTEGKPLINTLRFVLFGGGDIAPVTHEVVRTAEKDPAKRPIIHVSG